MNDPAPALRMRAIRAWRLFWNFASECTIKDLRRQPREGELSFKCPIQNEDIPNQGVASAERMISYKRSPRGSVLSVWNPRCRTRPVPNVATTKDGRLSRVRK